MIVSPKTTTTQLSLLKALTAKLRDYAILTKYRLNLTVVFSSVIGYLYAMQADFSLLNLWWLSLAGFLVTGSANGLNQTIEKDYDKLMKRTADRPVAAGRMSVGEALLVSGLMGVVGILVLMYVFNDLAAVIGAISLLLYAFVYTPLKRISPIAILVGAIPGALPTAIGWVAATGTIAYETYLLFAIQFLWQFPHFWAIGWLGAEEYAKAGFKLEPQPDERNQRTALQVIFYILSLIPVTVLPTIMHLNSLWFLIAAAVLNLFFLWSGVHLYKKCDNASALRLMFASIIYLPLIQLAMVLDRIFLLQH